MTIVLLTITNRLVIEVCEISMKIADSENYSLFLAILLTDPQNSRCVPPNVFLSLRCECRETSKTRFSIGWGSQTIYVGHAAGCSRSEEYELDRFMRIVRHMWRYHLVDR